MAIGRQTLTILQSCTLRADTICCFGKLATNFFVQNCMLPCRAVTFHDFTGANIGVAFRSIITHTDGFEQRLRLRIARRIDLGQSVGYRTVGTRMAAAAL